jgi:hypothetical protein
MRVLTPTCGGSGALDSEIIQAMGWVPVFQNSDSPQLFVTLALVILILDVSCNSSFWASAKAIAK